MSLNTSLDLYSILGLSYEADDAAILEAYRQATDRFHPDTNPNLGAKVHFEEVTAAYETLSNEVARRRYHQERLALGDLPGFNIELTASKRNLPVIEETQVLYVLVDIYPRKPKSLKGAASEDQDQDMERVPLNLALVLDRSKSMTKNGRLDHVKVAAYRVLEQMRPGDRISIVSFSDHADVLVPNTDIADADNLRSIVSVMSADGATEMFQGLEAAYKQVEAQYNENFVNHIILITDGHTYGDHDDCLELAAEAQAKGISISAMGMGDEWNDEFLDQLAGRTGGAADYISSPAAVTSFLRQRVGALKQNFGDRMEMVVACDADVVLETAFRLSPTAQPLIIDDQPIPLGGLGRRTPLSVMLQFQMPANMAEGERSVARIDVSGDVLSGGRRMAAKSLQDLIGLTVMESPPAEIPSGNIVEALSKMTLYRMQERAEDAIQSGDVAQATRRLEHLATRLLDIGQEGLANQARNEARRIASTHMFSEEGRKSLKFGTRHLATRAIPELE